MTLRHLNKQKKTQSTEPREQNLNAYKSFSHWSAEADRNMVCRRYCRFTGNSLNSGSICPILYLMCPCRIRVEQVSILLKLRLLYNSRIWDFTVVSLCGLFPRRAGEFKFLLINTPHTITQRHMHICVHSLTWELDREGQMDTHWRWLYTWQSTIFCHVIAWLIWHIWPLYKALFLDVKKYCDKCIMHKYVIIILCDA